MAEHRIYRNSLLWSAGYTPRHATPCCGPVLASRAQARVRVASRTAAVRLVMLVTGPTMYCTGGVPQGRLLLRRSLKEIQSSKVESRWSRVGVDYSPLAVNLRVFQAAPRKGFILGSWFSARQRFIYILLQANNVRSEPLSPTASLGVGGEGMRTGHGGGGRGKGVGVGC